MKDNQPFPITAEDMAIRREIANQMLNEVDTARAKYPPFNSAHEGFAILLEEVDELKAEVWRKQGMRNLEKPRLEAIQVGAMAIRFVEDICDKQRGQR